MQTASYALGISNAIESGFTYLDTLISGACSQGLHYIIIDGNKLDDEWLPSIRALGYVVTPRYTDMGTFPQYLISWEEAVDPNTPE